MSLTSYRAAPPRATNMRLCTAFCLSILGLRPAGRRVQPGFLRLSGLESEACFCRAGRDAAPPRATIRIDRNFVLLLRKYALTLWDLQSKRRLLQKQKAAS